MVSLEDLPAPLPLYIAKQLGNLKSLDSLRRSCPLFSIVFRQNAVELFEHLMEQTLLHDVVIELRAYTLLSLQNSALLETEGDFHFLYTQAGRRLDLATPVPVISHTLREFSFTASACDLDLRSKLDRLRRLPHEHLADKRLRSRDLVRTNPAGAAYSVAQTLPLQWLEQQRCLRAAFRMRISESLQGTARDFAARRLPPVPIAVRPEQQRPNNSADEIEEAMISFSEMQDAGLITNDHRVPVSWEALADVPLPRSKADAVSVAWGETLEDVVCDAAGNAVGFSWFHITSNRLPSSPLCNADWTVLRHLGFGVWSERRMAEELQLKNAPLKVKPPSEGRVFRLGVDDHLSSTDILFTWGRLYCAACEERARLQG